MLSFLMVARVLYDKGFQEYVNAAYEIKRVCPETVFYLAGNIDEEYPNHVPKEVLEKYVTDNIIVYLGYKDNIADIMKCVDCIVLPSYHEGMSRVLMEAIAMHKPVITSDIPGCREFVENGKTGFLCLPRSTGSLINAINSFMKLSKEDIMYMGMCGRKLAEEKYDIRDVISQYHQIVELYKKNKGCN